MIGPSRDHHTNEHQLTLPLWCFFGDERSPPRGLRVKSEAAPDTATKRSLFSNTSLLMMPYGPLSEFGEVSVSQLNGRIMIPDLQNEPRSNSE